MINLYYQRSQYLIDNAMKYQSLSDKYRLIRSIVLGFFSSLVLIPVLTPKEGLTVAIMLSLGWDLFQMFKNNFNVEPIYIPDQKGNYRETLRVNDDLINLLNWKPEDRLRKYIANLNSIL